MSVIQVPAYGTRGSAAIRTDHITIAYWEKGDLHIWTISGKKIVLVKDGGAQRVWDAYTKGSEPLPSELDREGERLVMYSGSIIGGKDATG